MDTLDILPRRVLRALLSLPTEPEEVRLRAGERPAALLPGQEEQVLDCPPLTPDELWRVAESAAGGSLWSAEGRLRQGCLSLPGGARLGVCGAVTVENGAVRAFSEISSLCLRLPHQAIGCARGLEALFEGGFRSTLIVSPPGGGKTTLLRELVRILSTGGTRVGLADERGEVAALWNGEPQLAVGPRTDVLSGAPKAEAAMALLRCMNPQVVAMDEITESADVRACLNCLGCGVRLLATAHGADLQDLRRRALYADMLAEGVFSRCVVIRLRGGTRRYEVTALD